MLLDYAPPGCGVRFESLLFGCRRPFLLQAALLGPLEDSGTQVRVSFAEDQKASKARRRCAALAEFWIGLPGGCLSSRFSRYFNGEMWKLVIWGSS